MSQPVRIVWNLTTDTKEKLDLMQETIAEYIGGKRLGVEYTAAQKQVFIDSFKALLAQAQANLNQIQSLLP